MNKKRLIKKIKHQKKKTEMEGYDLSDKKIMKLIQTDPEFANQVHKWMKKDVDEISKEFAGPRLNLLEISHNQTARMIGLVGEMRLHLGKDGIPDQMKLLVLHPEIAWKNEYGKVVQKEIDTHLWLDLTGLLDGHEVIYVGESATYVSKGDLIECGIDVKKYKTKGHEKLGVRTRSIVNSGIPIKEYDCKRPMLARIINDYPRHKDWYIKFGKDFNQINDEEANIINQNRHHED